MSQKVFLLLLITELVFVNESEMSSLGFSCPPGKIRINKPEGPICSEDKSYKWNKNGAHHQIPTTTLSPFGFDFAVDTGSHHGNGWESNRGNPSRSQWNQDERLAYLPKNENMLTPNDRECLANKKIFWPLDRNCYSLLEQGPCRSPNEWLVLHEVPNSEKIRIQCSQRPCPCVAKDPILCEVLLRNKKIEQSPGCSLRDQCRVAMAAEQEGICGHGEQLFLTPFGDGICGCRKDPLHVWVAGQQKCQQLFAQGHCEKGSTLQFSHRLGDVVCTPSLCPQGLTLYHEDGRCYKLNTRGPCDEHSLFKVDTNTKEANCVVESETIERVFDAMPDELEDIRSSDKIMKLIRIEPRIDDQPTEEPEVNPLPDVNLNAEKFLDWLWSLKSSQRYNNPDF